MTDVEAAVVSMSARSAYGRDAEYVEWHALDHRPEQYRIDGLKAGTRWVSTPACRAAWAVSGTPFDAVDHVVMYLFGGSLGPALDTFFELGADLRRWGRNRSVPLLAAPFRSLVPWQWDVALPT